MSYHVGCGIAGIYAGTMKPNGYEWRNKSDVTEEAIQAVATYMFFELEKGEKSITYEYKTRTGETIRLTLEKGDDE